MCVFTLNVFRAFPSRKLKFLAFNISKHYFLLLFFFNTSLYNIPNIKGSIFFITSFKYYFFILLLFSLSSYLCLSLSLKKPTTFFSIKANPLTQSQPQPWLATANHHHQKKKKPPADSHHSYNNCHYHHLLQWQPPNHQNHKLSPSSEIWTNPIQTQISSK